MYLILKIFLNDYEEESPKEIKFRPLAIIDSVF